MNAETTKRKPYSHYFRLYKTALAELKSCELSRGSTFGIAAKPIKTGDIDAERWQQIRMRVEILEAHLEGRKPNWYLCYHLPVEEMQRRNATYKA